MEKGEEGLLHDPEDGGRYAFQFDGIAAASGLIDGLSCRNQRLGFPDVWELRRYLSVAGVDGNDYGFTAGRTFVDHGVGLVFLADKFPFSVSM